MMGLRGAGEGEAVLEKIVRPKVSEAVMESLLGAISDGRIRIGEALPSERELCDMLGISRGSLREGLSVLEFLGVVVRQGNTRLVLRDGVAVEKALDLVRVSDRADMLLDLVEARRALEASIVRAACQHCNDEDLRRMTEAFERHAANVEDESADYRFHVEVARATHNVVFAALEDLLVCLMHSIRARTDRRPGRLHERVEEHRRILEAVRGRDPEGAVQAVLDHLDKIEAALRDQPAEAALLDGVATEEA